MKLLGFARLKLLSVVLPFFRLSLLWVATVPVFDPVYQISLAIPEELVIADVPGLGTLFVGTAVSKVFINRHSSKATVRVLLHPGIAVTMPWSFLVRT